MCPLCLVKNPQKIDKNYPSKSLFNLFGTVLYTHATLLEPLTHSCVIFLSLDYGAHKEEKDRSQQQLTPRNDGICMTQTNHRCYHNNPI